MGKHALPRKPSQRSSRDMFGLLVSKLRLSQIRLPKLQLPQIRLPRLPRLPRFLPRLLPKFATRSMTFSASLLLVTAVDPYSGNLASADSFMVGNSIYSGGQSLLIASGAEGDFERGGFEVLTGAQARKLFVANAPLPDPGSAKEIGLIQVQAIGWEYNEYSCLVKLWDRESNWRWNAENKSSGAYGIPQSLPGTKMASAGDDWMTNPATQIKWGLGYIKNRYKTPCGALAHSDEHNWY